MKCLVLLIFVGSFASAASIDEQLIQKTAHAPNLTPQEIQRFFGSNPSFRAYCYRPRRTFELSLTSNEWDLAAYNGIFPAEYIPTGDRELVGTVSFDYQSMSSHPVLTTAMDFEIAGNKVGFLSRRAGLSPLFCHFDRDGRCTHLVSETADHKRLSSEQVSFGNKTYEHGFLVTERTAFFMDPENNGTLIMEYATVLRVAAPRETRALGPLVWKIAAQPYDQWKIRYVCELNPGADRVASH